MIVHSSAIVMKTSVLLGVEDRLEGADVQEQARLGAASSTAIIAAQTTMIAYRVGSCVSATGRRRRRRGVPVSGCRGGHRDVAAVLSGGVHQRATPFH